MAEKEVKKPSVHTVTRKKVSPRTREKDFEWDRNRFAENLFLTLAHSKKALPDAKTIFDAADAFMQEEKARSPLTRGDNKK